MKLLQHEEGVAHTLTLAYTLRPTPYTITLHPAPSPVTITHHPAPNGEGQITNMYPREGARFQRETKIFTDIGKEGDLAVSLLP